MAIIRFEYEVPIEKTMEFDSIYLEGLQLTLEEKQDIWDTPGAIFAWILLDGELIGEAYGVPIVTYDEAIEGLGDLTAEEKQRAIYCYSNTILPAFQRRGLGQILKAHWLGLVVSKGFKIVYGHARPGGSQALNAKFGAVFLGDFPDWGNTGETYRMYRLVLTEARVAPMG